MSTTFGQSGAPNQDTINLDALLSLSLMNYNKTLVDNVSNAHPFWEKLKNKFKGKNGGVAVKQNLRYANKQGTTFAGYDEITITPTDGITQSTSEWRNYADAVVISDEEVYKNNDGLDDLLDTKIAQVEEGAQEFFSKYIIQGNKANLSSSTIDTAYTDSNNGSVFVDPISKLIAYDPTVSTDICGLNQSTNTWWRNKTLTMTATTEKDFLKQMDRMWNTVSLGVGGKPDLIIVDQTTAELWRAAYYSKYRRTADSMNDYPFPNFMFNDTPVTWDENVCDVYSGTTNTDTYGTAYFINSKFLTPYYVNGRNFKNRPFVRPNNQEAQSSLVVWSGTIGVSNRRKQGVVGKIPRTLTE
jgi:hypothetical protein